MTTEPSARVERVTAPMPTPATRWARTFLPWQLWRFLWINLRMVRMILLSHPHRKQP